MIQTLVERTEFSDIDVRRTALFGALGTLFAVQGVGAFHTRRSKFADGALDGGASTGGHD